MNDQSPDPDKQVPPDTTHLSAAKEVYVREGGRGLALINGGAAVALLAFLQAIWSDPAATDLIGYVLSGISVLVIGVAIASLIFLFRHIAFVRHHTTSRHFYYLLANRLMPLASIACFIFGMALVLYGGFEAIGAFDCEVNA